MLRLLLFTSTNLLLHPSSCFRPSSQERKEDSVFESIGRSPGLSCSPCLHKEEAPRAVFAAVAITSLSTLIRRRQSSERDAEQCSLLGGNSENGKLVCALLRDRVTVAPPLYRSARYWPGEHAGNRRHARRDARTRKPTLMPGEHIQSLDTPPSLRPIKLKGFL